MLALVGTVMSRSPSGNVLLRNGDGVLGTHTLPAKPKLGVSTKTRSTNLFNPAGRSGLQP